MPPKKVVEEETGCARFGRVRNNLKMGVVGLPNVGKSSLFNLLCEQSCAAVRGNTVCASRVRKTHSSAALQENYPFCTIEPNESRCAVPDDRYDWLCDLWKPPSTYPAYLHVTDIAGLVRGAATGAGLGNAFLSHIQAVDGVFHVVRAFESDDVIHVDDSVDPVRDLDTIQHELCAKDLEYAERAVADETRDVKRSPGMKLSALFIATMDRVCSMLKEDKPIRGGSWNSAEVELIRNKLPSLITTKPVVYLVNLSKADFIRKKNKWLTKIHEWVQSHGGGVMISVEHEEALWKARDDPDAKAALEDAANGGAKSVLPKIVKQGYSELALIYFFTAGEKEVRCWTVQEGALAPQAAGVIHTDFERGFIKAEVVSFADFKEHSKGASMADVKAAGKYRIEGKQYVVQSGDIIHFQFNVTTKGK